MTNLTPTALPGMFQTVKVDGAFRKRCERWDMRWHSHELTFSCYLRQEFLARERTRTWLLQAVEAARIRHAFKLWAYVIMPEHVHLLIHPRNEEYSISAILKSIKQSVSRNAVYWLRRNNPEGLAQLATGQQHNPYRFWQDGGGYDRNIYTRAVLKSSLDYIHNNPVKRGLTTSPSDWPWSSARDWLLGERGPIAIDGGSWIEGLL